MGERERKLGEKAERSWRERGRKLRDKRKGTLGKGGELGEIGGTWGERRKKLEERERVLFQGKEEGA